MFCRASLKPSLKLCRALVIVLLFNAIVPAVMAADKPENGQVLICTSAGLIKVSLGEFDGNSDGSVIDDNLANDEHCPYCQLTELSNCVPQNLPPYLAPDAIIALSYQSLLTTRAAQYITEHRRLRAPPLGILS